MRATIYQPRYLPQLHYFNRIFSADIFVILESAQYTKALVHLVNNKRERHKSYQSDTVIKAPGGAYFLTIPIRHNGLQALNQAVPDYNAKWHKKHVNTIKTLYKKSPFFASIFPQLEQVLLCRYDSLAELNRATILWGIAMLLDFPLKNFPLSLNFINDCLKKTSSIRLKNIITDTETGVKRPEGVQKGTEWTTAICKTIGADEYIHGKTARDSYMDLAYYKKNGIHLIAQNWKCLPYRQQFADRTEFIPNLSLIDLLFNVEREEACTILGIK